MKGNGDFEAPKPGDRLELWLVPVERHMPRKLDIDLAGWDVFGGIRLHPNGRADRVLHGQVFARSLGSGERGAASERGQVTATYPQAHVDLIALASTCGSLRAYGRHQQT